MFTKKDIINQLKELNAPTNSIVLIHSSLKAIGAIEGRAEALLDTFIEYFTSDGGLLCIPAHTWDRIGDLSRITLDFSNPQTCIGTLSNIAVKHQNAVRSCHPTHSMAVFGDKMRVTEFVSGEEIFDTPANPKGCYGKIYNNNGYILLIGVGHNRNTYLHCVEEMLDVPNRISKVPKKATIQFSDGTVTEKWLHPHEAIGIGDVSLKYPKFEQAFRYHNCITDGKIGNADGQLCNARKMKDVMEMIYLRSGKKDLLTDDTPIPTQYYI